MGKSTHAVTAIASAIGVTFNPSVTSVSDGAYQQAKLHGTTRDLVSSMMGLIPGLGSNDDALTDDIKVELKKGYALRWAEENPARYFVAVDGNWIECKTEEEMMGHKKAQKFVLDVHTAFALHQQAFGALKNEEPQKHAIIKDVRDRFNKYASNRMGDLKRDAKRLYNERNGIQRERTGSALFMDWLLAPEKGGLAVIRQRCVNAVAKKDDTADTAKIDKAIAAFKSALK